MQTRYRPLRLNVGFLLSQTAGYGRDFDFHEDRLAVGSDLRVDDFTGHLVLSRTPQGIFAKGDFKAVLPTECARCLKEINTPINLHLEDLFVYPPQNATDPLLSIGEDAHMDLEPIVREFLIINQPVRPLCRPDCKGLCPVCGSDRNDGPCGHETEAEPQHLLTHPIVIQEEHSHAAVALPALKAKPDGEPPASLKPAGKPAPIKQPTAVKPAAVKKTPAAKKMAAKPARKPPVKASAGKPKGGKAPAAARKTSAGKTTSKKKK